MRVVLQGSLQHFSPIELLHLLRTREGTFDAQSDGEHVRLALRGGQVVAAEGSGSEEAADAAAKLLQWTDGTFTFLDEVVLPEGALAAPMEMDALVAEAKSRIAEGRRINALYPDDGVRFRVVNRPPGEINITAEEFQILFQIGGGKSLAQLRSDSGRAVGDLYPIIKRLQMTGLIEPADDPDATSPRAKQAPAQAVVQLPVGAEPVAAPRPRVAAEPVAVPTSAPPPTEPGRRAVPQSAQQSVPKPVSLPPAAVAPPPSPDPTPPAPVQPPSPEPAPAPAAGATLHSVEAPLVATLTADDGTMHPLLDETSTIGRTSANAIALRDSSVSAKHARVLRAKEGFFIEDVGSRNGTFVNSEKLTDKRLLADGDLVRLGKIILTFSLASVVKKGQSTEREMIK